ncbi:uncharacterized protein KY384_005423 [Bacidia gigantensis]|uniref:uncharacterized protein n=1 Tax=Bacidia gigantensis TaxID=2732470 RepID=UPI001D0512F0|nr:uncharacterized protein KY384_005423 [Bacidia gigantensis]KAG8529942.1 hypothetical protein KY384_005423 [Bacidia gigantensis]
MRIPVETCLLALCLADTSLASPASNQRGQASSNTTSLSTPTAANHPRGRSPSPHPYASNPRTAFEETSVADALNDTATEAKGSWKHKKQKKHGNDTSEAVDKATSGSQRTINPKLAAALGIAGGAAGAAALL